MVHHQKTTIYHLEEYAYTLFKRRTSKSKYIIYISSAVTSIQICSVCVPFLCIIPKDPNTSLNRIDGLNPIRRIGL